MKLRTTDIPIDIFHYPDYMVDKKNVIMGEDRRATLYGIARKELEQNAHSKWRMFSATLTSSINVLPLVHSAHHE